MRYVLEQVRKHENKQKISVIWLEIDYELVTLHDAMKSNDQIKIIKTKEKLSHLVYKLNALSNRKTSVE